MESEDPLLLARRVALLFVKRKVLLVDLDPQANLTSIYVGFLEIKLMSGDRHKGTESPGNDLPTPNALELQTLFVV